MRLADDASGGNVHRWSKGTFLRHCHLYLDDMQLVVLAIKKATRPMLKTGKTAPLAVASAMAVRALMERRTGDGTVERPDVDSPNDDVEKVDVRVNAPKAEAFLQRCKKAPPER